MKKLSAEQIQTNWESLITIINKYINDDRKEKFYMTFKLFPGLNSFSKAVELFPQQKYERY